MRDMEKMIASIDESSEKAGDCESSISPAKKEIESESQKYFILFCCAG